MTVTVVCSICSREKRDDKNPLPARDRYIGSHVSKVGDMAGRLGKPFFILSGVHGLIPADKEIDAYDHLLVASEVTALAERIRIQLRDCEVEEIHFYTKNKPNWEPYLQALRQATSILGVVLRVHELAGDD